MNLKEHIERIDNYPVEGVIFRDITTLIGDGEAFKYTIDALKDFCQKSGATKIVGPEARGFIFGTPVAYSLGIPFIPVRKPNKLPRETIFVEYELEYGTNTLCMHQDAIKKGDKVVIVDDLLATGGTILASIDLIKRLGGEVCGLAFVIELDELGGRKLLDGYDILSLVNY